MKNIVPLIIVVLVQSLLISIFIGSEFIFKETNYLLGVPSSLVFLIVLNVLSLILLGRMYQSEVNRKVQLTESTHEKEFHSLVASVRSDRHDLNNHLTVISGLLKIGNINETKNYVKELIGDIQLNNQALKIHNPILASVLFTKMEKFRRDQVTFTLKILSEEIMNTLPSTDFIRLMSNLLDNAYDATMELPEEDRLIFLKIEEINGQLAIEVKNSSKLKEFDHSLFEIEHSTKAREECKSRGYGLSIIKEISQRYNGVLDVKIEDELVCFRTLFLKR